MKGNLARAACFENSRSCSASEGLANGKPPSTSSTSGASAGASSSNRPKPAAGIVDEGSTDVDISAEYQFTTDVASLSKRSVEVIMLDILLDRMFDQHHPVN